MTLTSPRTARLWPRVSLDAAGVKLATADGVRRLRMRIGVVVAFQVLQINAGLGQDDPWDEVALSRGGRAKGEGAALKVGQGLTGLPGRVMTNERYSPGAGVQAAHRVCAHCTSHAPPGKNRYRWQPSAPRRCPVHPQCPPVLGRNVQPKPLARLLFQVTQEGEIHLHVLLEFQAAIKAEDQGVGWIRNGRARVSAGTTMLRLTTLPPAPGAPSRPGPAEID